MTVGDLGAQSLEHRRMQQLEDTNEASTLAPAAPLVQNRPTRKVNFRRYGTLSPRVEEIQHQLHEEHHKHHHQEKSKSKYWLQLSTWKQEMAEIAMDWRLELDSFDFFRTSTMMFWSVAVYTPFFVGLYRIFDRFLPAGGKVAPVIMRTMGSFLASIPLNGVFFSYGTAVHHFTEWMERVDQQFAKQRDNWFECAKTVPIDWKAAAVAAQMKLQSELLSTITMGAQIWIPINLLNFSFAPPHLRPLTLQFASIFWNGYLSLAQHRDVEVEEDEKANCTE